jgi:hypothetical protein
VRRGRLPTTPAASPGAAGGFREPTVGEFARVSKRRRVVALLLIVLLLILILGGIGLAVLKLLFWIALIMFVLWVVGFFVRGAEGARWYRR